MKRTIVCLALSVGLGALFIGCDGASAGDNNTDSSSSTTVHTPNRHERLNLPEGMNYQETLEAWSFVVWLQAWEQGQYIAYLDGIRQAYLDEQARIAESRRPVYSAGGVGDCTGFVIPDYIIQRESGGDPNAHNASSGAHGCTQTLMSHYSSGGACAGLDPNTIQGQRDCTYILSDGGSNLQPWAATR